MQGRPTAAELVAAVAAFLDDEVHPQLAGRVAFHAKVAANVLRIVERELTIGPESDPAAVEELARRIRGGEVPVDDPALRDHLIREVLARLAVDSPTYPSLRDVPDSWRSVPPASG